MTRGSSPRTHTLGLAAAVVLHHRLRRRRYTAELQELQRRQVGVRRLRLVQGGVICEADGNCASGGPFGGIGYVQ